METLLGHLEYQHPHSIIPHVRLDPLHQTLILASRVDLVCLPLDLFLFYVDVLFSQSVSHDVVQRKQVLIELQVSGFNLRLLVFDRKPFSELLARADLV